MDNLNQIAKEEQIHYAKCSICNSYFDCRDLSEVVDHFHDDIPEVKFDSSRRIDEPVEYITSRYRLNQN
jgi:hypothetical protein